MQKLTEEEVVKQYLPLIRHMSWKYSFKNEIEDFVSVGMMAVMLAHRSYDETKGASFDTYTGQQIRFALGKYARKSRSGFYIPHETNRTAQVISREGLEDCTSAEIAKKLGITERKARFALIARSRGMTASSDAEVVSEEGVVSTIIDSVKHHDDLSHIDANAFVKTLTDRERFILERLSDGAMQPEIAKELNTYQMKISRELKVIRDKYTKWERIS